MIERKRTIKTKVDDKTTEINNNINIKVSNEPPKVPEVPVKKKRKKRKKKISKAVKDDFLNTLNEYKASGGTESVVNVGDIKKLTEPEIIDITTNLRTKILALKEPPAQKAIAGAPSQMALPAPQTRMALPPPTTDYSQIPPRASQGFSNLRPSSLPPVEVRPSSLPPVEKRETSLQQSDEQRLSMSQLDKNNWVDSITYYILQPDNKIVYDNMIKNILSLSIDDNKVSETIKNRLTELFSKVLTPTQLEQKQQYYMQIYKNIRSRNELQQPQTSELVPSILPFLTPEEYKKSIVLLDADADANKINTYFEGFKRWNATDNIEKVNILGTEATRDKLGILIRFMNQYQYTLKSPSKLAPPTPSEAPPTPSEAPPTPSEEPVSPDTLKLNQSPKMFYEKWYPNGNYSGSNTKGPPSVKELQNIIKIQDPSAVISGKLKGDLVRLFQQLYKDSLIANPEPTTSPEPPPTPPQPDEFSTPQTTPRETQPTEITPETCRNNNRRGGGIFNPCLGEYEKYLKDLINTNNTRELKIQYEKALKKQPSPVMSNVAIVNDIIELTDYVPQLANDNFYKYEMSQRGLTVNQTNDIIKKFYTDFYPDGEYTSTTKPTYDKIIEMIQLLDPTFTTDETDEIILSAVFIDKYNKKFPKPIVEDDTNFITDYDEVYIKRSEEAENVELLEAIYKRYFKKDFVVSPGRTSRGDITFDIVQALNTKKKSLTDELSVKSPPSTIEQNEVLLSFLICNGSYDTVRAESFNQVKYLPQYSDNQVAVYQDDRTIYFCSVGSRSPLALNEQQSREDWLQSDLAILLGLSTSAFSPRFDEEQIVLNRVVSAIQPSVVIFTGHSLGGRLSNELFFNAIKNGVSYQPFSITFNAGSGIPQFIDRAPFNPDYIKNRILQFHVNYDPLSATNIFGTIVGLPATMFTFSHQLTNFGPFNWTPYQNFIENGLKYTQPYKDPNDKTATITPEAGDVIVPENTPQPYTNPQEVDTEVVPEIVQTPSIEIIRKLKILDPFYTRFYPSGVFKQLNNSKPSIYELVYMIRLIDANFVTDGLTRDMLQKIFNDKYVKYKEKNQFVNP
jgi:hypothetical protein